MVSLKESWRQQREQRQQEVIKRQQQVRDTLAELHQTRQVHTAQLRQDLQLFQLKLQQQTQDFLSACTADRTLMAQQLQQELSEFRLQLARSVGLLRQDLQSQIQQMQVDVQIQLQNYRQERLQTQLQLMQSLAEYIETLQSEVQAQLIEYGIVRQDRTQQLRQMLQENGDCRRAEVAALFQELSEFRAELRAYCVDLRQFVWGEASTTAAIETKAATVTDEKEPETAVDNTAQKSNAVPTVVNSQLPAVKNLAETTDPQKATVSLEEAVYTHLHETQGARLNEIEAVLGINRFQAIDTLRTLIRKGLVTQRDRIYLIQEEVKL